jgi:hypothetical protein
LVLSAILVLVTWRYARSTDVIARETSSAADSARVATQVALLQSLLSVQPLFEVSKFSVEYWRGDADAPRPGVPYRVLWDVTNTGMGTAFRPSFGVTLGTVVFSQLEQCDPASQVERGMTVSVSHAADPPDWTALREAASSPDQRLGCLRANCRDAYGGTVELELELTMGPNGEIVLGESSRRYEGGADLKIMLRRLLAELIEHAAP